MNRAKTSGIGGIERKIQSQQEETDRNISDAFSDLRVLMSKAKEMSTLSKNIAGRIKEKGNREISDDETVVFKSHLLSLGVEAGIEDPVTREKFTSDNKYYVELGKQVAAIMRPIISSGPGQMSLTDVYCTVNRARGIELISTEDLLHACQAINKMNIGLRMVKYESGLIVLQADTFDSGKVDEDVLETIQLNVRDNVGLTAHQLAIHSGVSVSIARQRLLNAEKRGLICRDESIHGHMYFPNKFLDPAVVK